MANAFKGEIDIIINDITYPMIVDMGVIAEFESETGEDFMNLSIKAINTMFHEGVVDSLKSSYPLLFTALVEFAIIGKVKKKTKKVKT